MDTDIKTALLAASEEVLGLPQDEMLDNYDLDLAENEMIDSFGCVALMNAVEETLGKQIDMSRMVPDDFISLSAMEKAIARII